MTVSAETKEIFHRRVKEYSNMVTRICLFRLGNREDVEDCWQNVFLKLYDSKMIEAPSEDVKRWLIRVAVNECNNALRRRLRHREENVDDCVIPIEDSHDKELLELVLQLPEAYRDAIYLYYYEEYSVKEISCILKRRENTVKSQLLRGREILKTELKDL